MSITVVYAVPTGHVLAAIDETIRRTQPRSVTELVGVDLPVTGSVTVDGGGPAGPIEVRVPAGQLATALADAAPDLLADPLRFAAVQGRTTLESLNPWTASDPVTITREGVVVKLHRSITDTATEVLVVLSGPDGDHLLARRVYARQATATFKLALPKGRHTALTLATGWHGRIDTAVLT